MSISDLNYSLPITDEDKMTLRFREWANQVTLLSPLDGEGSPEGVVEATQLREYIDTLGVAGAIKYVKRDADIGGDRTLGWIPI